MVGVAILLPIPQFLTLEVTMLLGGGLITAVFMIVFGLIITMGWFDWLVHLGGIIMIAWGIILAVIAVTAGSRRSRF